MDKIINIVGYIIFSVAAIIFAAILILYCIGKMIAVWVNLIWQFICTPYTVFKVAITATIPVIQDTIEQLRKSDM